MPGSKLGFRRAELDPQALHVPSPVRLGRRGRAVRASIATLGYSHGFPPAEPCGPVRGPTRQIVPAERVPSMR